MKSNKQPLPAKAIQRPLGRRAKITRWTVRGVLVCLLAFVLIYIFSAEFRGVVNRLVATPLATVQGKDVTYVKVGDKLQLDSGDMICGNSYMFTYVYKDTEASCKSGSMSNGVLFLAKDKTYTFQRAGFEYSVRYGDCTTEQVQEELSVRDRVTGCNVWVDQKPLHRSAATTFEKDIMFGKGIGVDGDVPNVWNDNPLVEFVHTDSLFRQVWK